MVIDDRPLRMRLQDRSKFTDEEYNNLKQMYPNFGQTYIKILEYSELNEEKEERIQEITQEVDYLQNMLSLIDEQIDEIQVKKNEYVQLREDFVNNVLKDTTFKNSYLLDVDNLILSLSDMYMDLIKKRNDVQKLYDEYNSMLESYTSTLNQLENEIRQWYSTYTILTETEVTEILQEQRSWL